MVDRNRVTHEFHNLPLTQIVCNLHKDLAEAKVVPCTEIGHKIASNLVRVAASKIFADPFQAIMEIIANALDAQTRNENPIGRFGMGFYSVFGLLLEGHFDTLTVVTTSAKDTVFTTYRLTVTVARNRELVANLVKVRQAADQTGTTVALSINSASFLPFDVTQRVHDQVTKFRFVPNVQIWLGMDLVNTLAAREDRAIFVDINQAQCSVSDTGDGMSKEVIQKLLIPSESTKGLQRAVAMNQEPECKLVASNVLALVICVNGVIVKQLELPSVQKFDFMAGLSVVLLPSSCKLPVARDNVFLSDPSTFEVVSQAFSMLVQLHIATSNTIPLRALVNFFVRDSMQPEAFKIAEQVDKQILASNVLLIPENDPVISAVCNVLGLSFTVSDLVSATSIEKAILAKAAKGNRRVAKITTSIFAHSTAIVFKKFNHAIAKSPYLPSLVFVRETTNDQTIREFCENPKNACMTVQVFNALASIRVVTQVNPDKFRLYAQQDVEDPERIRRWGELFTDSRLRLINSAAILWVNLLTGLMPDPADKFDKFIEIWLRVDMDIAKFEETLSLLMQRLGSLTVRHNYTARYDTAPLRDPMLLDLMPTSVFTQKVFKHEKQPRTVFKNAGPVPELELSLLNFKLEIFPRELKPDFYVPVFCGLRHTFCDLCDLLEDYGYSTGIISSVLNIVLVNSLHIVESFFVMQLFCLFTSSSRPLSFVKCRRSVKTIQQELRKHVSLNTMIYCYTELISGNHSTVPATVPNIIDPISNIFPVISESINEKPAAVLRTLSAWGDVKGPTEQYEFSVNDLMVFAYSEQSLTQAEDFVKPETLAALVQFSSTREATSGVQAVKIAANYGSTTPRIIKILLELFQNSSDAIASSNLKKAQRAIQIQVDRTFLSFKDPVGMRESSLLSFLIPFFSEKIQDDRNSGQMGTGGFSLFSQPLCKCVEVYTKAKREAAKKIVLTPRVENGMVVDVNVALTLSQDHDAERATTITVYFNKEVNGFDVACQVTLECHSKFFIAPMPVYLNGQQINKDMPEEIFAVPGVLTVRGFFTKQRAVPSIITINNVPFGSLVENWGTLMMTDTPVLAMTDMMREDMSLLQPNFKFNVAIDINKDMLDIKQSRSRLEFHDASVTQGVQQGQLIWMLKKYSLGMVARNFIMNTGENGHIAQLRFVNGKGLNPVGLDANWLPAHNNEFVDLLHWVINQVIASQSPDHKGTANTLIDEMHIQDWIKDALKVWFSNKPSSEHSASDRQLSGLEPVDEIIMSKSFTTLPVTELFVRAFVEVFNASLQKRLFELTTYNPLDSKASVSVAHLIDMPRIGCVTASTKFPSIGMWVKRHKMLLLNFDHEEHDANFMIDVKNEPELIHEVFPNLVLKHFFRHQHSTIIHEMLHCIFHDEHKAVYHPNVKFTWVGTPTEENSFDGITLTLYRYLCQQGFNTRFLELIQTGLKEKKFLIFQ